MGWKGKVAGWLDLAGNLELLHEHLGVPSALVVFLTAAQRKIIGRAFDESSLRLEVRKRLRR